MQPRKKEADHYYAESSLRELGSLENVLASSVSLEIKKACIEMAIEAREETGKRKGPRGE